ALRRLVALHARPATWAAIQRAGMRQPLGWEVSAATYAGLYAGLVA
ncbi:MAG: hypothetical protein H5U20_07860, partial [Rhodobacteraceae bacterium]|nr:hypothetical protein [Paracoccaceae bacterium]